MSFQYETGFPLVNWKIDFKMMEKFIFVFIWKEIVDSIVSKGHNVSSYSSGSVVCAISVENGLVYANSDHRKRGDVAGTWSNKCRRKLKCVDNQIVTLIKQLFTLSYDLFIARFESLFIYLLR